MKETINIESLINCLDNKSLMALYPNWNDLNRRESFACLNSFFTVRKSQKILKGILESKKSELKKMHFWSLFQLRLFCETKKDLSTYLYQALADYNLTKDPDSYICGEYTFLIGFTFAKLNNFDLAKKYHEESRKLFMKADLLSLAWRSLLNIAICDLRLKKWKDFEKKICILEQDFIFLPVSARAALSRFLIALYLYSGEEKRAYQLCCQWMNSIHDPSLNEEVSYICKYYYFIILSNPDLTKSEKSSSLGSLKLLNYSAQKTIHYMLKIVECKTLEVDYLRNRFLEWKKNVDIIDLLLLADLQFQYLALFEQFDSIYEFYQLIESELIDLNYLIPANDLRLYGVVASRFKSQKSQATQILHTIEKSSSKKRLQKTYKQIEKIDRNVGLSQIVEIDTYKFTISVFGKHLSLKNRKKMLKLILLLNYHSRLSMRQLKEHFYPHKIVHDPERNIRRRLQKFNQELGLEFFCVHIDEVFIANRFRIKELSYKENKLDRVDQVISIIAKLSPVAISTIERVSKIPRRTLQKDLQKLIESGKIITEGKGRSLKYLSISS